MNHKVFIKRSLLLLSLFIFMDFLISIVLLNGLNKYYGINRRPDILINGSSMAMSGFNRSEIENLTKENVALYSHEGVSVYDREAMISHFYHMFPEGVKAVIYEVSPVMFSNIKTAENVYTIFYPYMDDKAIDRYIKEKAGISEYYIHKIIRTKRFDSRLIPNVIKGYLGKYDNLKTNTLDPEALLPLIDQQDKKAVIMAESSIEVFENTIDMIRAHNSDVVLVMMPMYFIKYRTFNAEGYEKLCDYFEEYCSTRKGVEFLDLNQDSIIFNAKYFSDELHFNVYGQRCITDIISSYLMGN